MVANGSAPKRNRFTFALPKSRIEGVLAFFRRGAIWGRISICLTCMLVLWLGTGGWNPPFPYRTRFVPERELVARVEFEFENDALRVEQQSIVVSNMPCIYGNESSKVRILQDGVIEELFSLIAAPDYDEGMWRDFNRDGVSPKELEDSFKLFRQELVEHDNNLEKTKTVVSNTLKFFVERGMLKKLEHEVFQGSSVEILVYQDGEPDVQKPVQVDEVRITTLEEKLYSALKKEYADIGGFSQVDLLAEKVAYWIFSNSTQTLHLDVERTREKRDEERASVPIVRKKYGVGDKLVHDKRNAVKGQGIVAGLPLDESDIEVLKSEHEAFVGQLNGTQKLIYTLADFGLYTAVILSCGSYMYFRERRIIRDIGRFTMVLTTLVTAIIIAYQIDDSWRVELIPLTVFAMIISLVYRHEIAWILGAGAALVATYSLGLSLGDFVVYVSAIMTGSLLCTEISSRTKLVYVGLLMALITFATTLGSGVMSGQAITWNTIATNQLLLASWYGFCAFLSALLITVILPFVEQLFDVQTDLTLLEWSDPSHELLNKLIQRAPGTYNHSINVASIAETAADAIGANGLLCRVGAYFHDIGKMLKPEYFVENQTSGENKHDALVPAMSSLVIIAHVKDGVELARKHKLPTSMIDMIEQHHGTTRVEYFYDQACKDAKEKGDEDEVDEANFRYPGPKPQTKEACVMMLADAVESACRTLTEPAPARIENLVQEISAKKLNDGQFTECPLTLRELHNIEQSLTKSLISVYHSRIKYPEQNGHE